MKKILLFATIIAIGCSKKTEQPENISTQIEYKSLNDFQLDYSHSLNLDMNNDGVIDFAFAASVIYDDVVSIEKLDFRAYTLNGSEYFNDNITPKVFDKSEIISRGNSQNHSWTRNNAFLATRVYTDDPAVSTWDGAWKDKTNKYLAIKLKQGDKYHTGWIRMSIGGNHSRIIIHDYAYSKVADKDIKAGEVN